MRIAIAAALIALISSLSVSCKPRRPVAPLGPLLARVDSTVNDRSDVAITVLNQNLAVVRETRRVRLAEGRQQIRFIGVSDKIVPESIRVKTSEGAEPVVFEEQNYDANLLTPARVAELAVGVRVRAFETNPVTGVEERLEGILLNEQSDFLIQTEEGVRELHPDARIEMDTLPDGLTARPVLSWIAAAPTDGEFNIEVIYLTRGISWRADYVVDIDQQRRLAKVHAWATIDNTTALSLQGATLQLLAGDVNLLNEPIRLEQTMIVGTEADALPPPPPMPKQEELFEYHLYTVQRPLSIRARQQKQIALTAADNVPFAVLHLAWFTLSDRTIKNIATALRIDLEHEKGGPLDVPLPAGKAALWTEDVSIGQRIQVGEISVDHTPVGEPLRLELPGDPAIAGMWIPERARHDDEGRFIVDGELRIRNNHHALTRAEVRLNTLGDPDVSLQTDGKDVPRADAATWKLMVDLKSTEEKTFTIRTRP